ncbi:MAG: ferritin-like domain-containing protein [Acidimicrobiia bacterium]|nr:ferritin-like domain-containing protein [Acidimicrobiia bacterium]
MQMAIDDQRLGELIVESQDLQADSRLASAQVKPDLVEVGRSRRGRPVDQDQVRAYGAERRRLLRNGGFGLGTLASRGLIGTAFGTAVTGIVAAPVSAQENVDVQILQTAASLENLAVATYGAALTLPFFNENQVVVTFAQMTMSQHAEHGAAFNAAAEDLDAMPQEATNPRYQPIVDAAVPTLVDYLSVVNLAATLEEVAGDTYLANLSLLQDTELRTLMASVLAVETQHLAVLRAVRALLEGGAPQLIALPTDVAALPPAAGSVGFPESFYEANMASPPEEGAL